MKITASDGSVGFKTFLECLAYERELVARQEREKVKSESEKIAIEIVNTVAKLNQLYKAYCLLSDNDIKFALCDSGITLV